VVTRTSRVPPHPAGRQPGAENVVGHFSRFFSKFCAAPNDHVEADLSKYAHLSNLRDSLFWRSYCPSCNSLITPEWARYSNLQIDVQGRFVQFLSDASKSDDLVKLIGRSLLETKSKLIQASHIPGLPFGVKTLLNSLAVDVEIIENAHKVVAGSTGEIKEGIFRLAQCHLIQSARQEGAK